ncbi:MAG: hypothetical protein V1779_15230 [bacterium]
MKTLLTKLFVLLTSIILFTSCEELPNADKPIGVRIKKVTLKSSVLFSGSYEFKYSGEKLVEIIIRSDYDSTSFESRKISYKADKIIYESSPTRGVEILNKNGTTVQKKWYIKSEDSNILTIELIKTYEYDKGKLVRQNQYFAEVTEKSNRYDEIQYINDTLTYINFITISPSNVLEKRAYMLISHDSISKYRSMDQDSSSYNVDLIYDSQGRLIKTEGYLSFWYEYSNDGLMCKQTSSENQQFIYEYEVGNGNAGIIWNEPLDDVFYSPSRFHFYLPN